VKVPLVPKGRYVLSFRLDAESTRQVWQSCSDVEITNEDRLARPLVSNRRHVCVGKSWGLDVDECDAWVNFYDAMNGPNWRGCSSSRLDPCGCPQNSWGHTVFCNSYQNYQHIHEIYLLHNNLTGSIPVDVGRFTHLLALDLSENDIEGVVPLELGTIPTLQALWLHHNPRLGGHLPRSLAQPKFYALELQWCNFSGPLPPIDFLNISNCLLYGSVFDCPVPEQACGAACRERVPLALV